MKRVMTMILPLILLGGLNAWSQVNYDIDKPDKDAELLKVVSETPGLSIDTTFVKKYKVINDYSMIGVQYGVNMATAMYNPSRSMKMQIRPIDISILYTRYCRMFGYMPYFGFQGGITYTEHAYEFAENINTGYPSFNMLGAYKIVTPAIEVPLTAQMHYDFWKMKLMVDIGFHMGYRLGIHREYNDSQCRPQDERRVYQDTFHPNEYRLFYGFHGGAGLGLVFDPIEIHIKAHYKYGLSYLHKPNISTRSFIENEDKSNYYYNWGNANNIVISIGIHYQITRRIGSTTKSLREEAKRQAREAYAEAASASANAALESKQAKLKETKAKEAKEQNEENSSESR